MEVAVEGGDDRVALVMPEVQHPLGLQLHYDNNVQGVGIEVVVWGGTDIHKALDVAAGRCVAHLLGSFICGACFHVQPWADHHNPLKLGFWQRSLGKRSVTPLSYTYKVAFDVMTDKACNI